MSEIKGINKITKYLDAYTFQKIVLSRGVNTVYLDRVKNGESKTDLIERFESWVNEFIEPDNFKDYKLEIFGTYSEKENAKLSPIVKTIVSFYDRPSMSGIPAQTIQREVQAPINYQDYLNLAIEKTKLENRVEQLEDAINGIDDDIDEENAPMDVKETITNALVGKIDTIIDVVLARLLPTPVGNLGIAINGIPETDQQELDEWEQLYYELKKVDVNILSDMAKLLHLANTQPAFFNMLIQNLRGMK
jgi:hypothetical protein